MLKRSAIWSSPLIAPHKKPQAPILRARQNKAGAFLFVSNTIRNLKEQHLSAAPNLASRFFSRLAVELICQICRTLRKSQSTDGCSTRPAPVCRSIQRFRIAGAGAIRIGQMPLAWHLKCSACASSRVLLRTPRTLHTLADGQVLDATCGVGPRLCWASGVC
jgi:hypothetical protein